MAERVRRREDDDRAARPAHLSLRDHHSGLLRWANSHLPRCAAADSWRSLRAARVPPVRYRDKPVPRPERGARLDADPDCSPFDILSLQLFYHSRQFGAWPPLVFREEISDGLFNRTLFLGVLTHDVRDPHEKVRRGAPRTSRWTGAAAPGVELPPEMKQNCGDQREQTGCEHQQEPKYVHRAAISAQLISALTIAMKSAQQTAESAAMTKAENAGDSRSSSIKSRRALCATRPSLAGFCLRGPVQLLLFGEAEWQAPSMPKAAKAPLISASSGTGAWSSFSS